MIKRYSPAEISAVWSEENKFRIWLDVEIAAMECQAQPVGSQRMLLPERQGKSKIQRRTDR